MLNNILNDYKYQECLSEAVATGENVDFASWIEVCNAPIEDCYYDIVTLTITPTGEKQFH